MKGMCCMDLHYLLFIALILMSTKVFGLMTKKINLPQVVGALAAGLVLGPGLHLVEETEFIKNLSEIGVIVLMFSAASVKSASVKFLLPTIFPPSPYIGIERLA